MYRMFIIIIAVVFTGCYLESPNDSMEFEKPPQLSFESGVVPQDEQKDEFSIEAGTGEIEITGYFWTPQAGYTFSADIDGYAKTINLNVSGEQTHPGITIPIQYEYKAVISELPAGTYTLRINHYLRDYSETVVETVIEVS